jgi:hypothetical protein
MAESLKIGGKPRLLEGSGANHYISGMNHIATDAAPSVSMTTSAAAKVAKLVAGEGNPNLMLRLAVRAFPMGSAWMTTPQLTTKCWSSTAQNW